MDFKLMLDQMVGQFENLNNNNSEMEDTELNFEAGLLLGRLSMFLELLPANEKELRERANNLHSDIVVFSKFN